MPRDVVFVLAGDGLQIPGNLTGLEDFRRWALSDVFPERGRIDWMEGEVVIEMSPEDLNTHGAPKSAIAGDLRSLIEPSGRGVVYIDSARLTGIPSDLSSEPDVLVVFFESVQSGRVRLTSKSTGEEGRFVEVQGGPDLVVEVVSDSSVHKDRFKLPSLYFSSGVREYWIVDARKPQIELTLQTPGAGSYEVVTAAEEGFVPSPVLGVSVRLVRLPEVAGLARFRLESR